jgi:hypothetical protein
MLPSRFRFPLLAALLALVSPARAELATVAVSYQALLATYYAKPLRISCDDRPGYTLFRSSATVPGTGDLFPVGSVGISSTTSRYVSFFFFFCGGNHTRWRSHR